jgi:hypothetical protein
MIALFKLIIQIFRILQTNFKNIKKIKLIKNKIKLTIFKNNNY